MMTLTGNRIIDCALLSWFLAQLCKVVLDLILEDAVFAASDESQSLAMTTGTLKTRNGKIVTGE